MPQARETPRKVLVRDAESLMHSSPGPCARAAGRLEAHLRAASQHLVSEFPGSGPQGTPRPLCTATALGAGMGEEGAAGATLSTERPQAPQSSRSGRVWYWWLQA